MAVAVREVDHFLDPGTNLRRKNQRICKAQGFAEQLQQLLSAFLDLSSLCIDCGLRHFYDPRATQAKPLPPLGAEPHPCLKYQIPGKVYTSDLAVSE